MTPPAGIGLIFTIEFSGPTVPGGTGFVFDQSTSPAGGCAGRQTACRQNVGTVTVQRDAFDVPYVLIWNGSGPSDPALYFNAYIAHMP